MDDRMRVAIAAFEDLVGDTDILFDPDMGGHANAAVVVQIERDSFGSPNVDVSVAGLDGAQIAFVLDVARRHELNVREERGWLRLQPHYSSADVDVEALEEAKA